MTDHERKIAVLLASILQGQITVAQLRRRVTDGKAQAQKLGPGPELRKRLEAINVGEEALARIEREKVKYDRLKNN